MCYDAKNGEVVLFGGDGPAGGGTIYDDTWVWDGAVWTQKNPAHKPSTRFGAWMWYDTGIEKVVLYSGVHLGSEARDTWLWDGSDWTEVTSLVGTPPADRGGTGYGGGSGVFGDNSTYTGLIFGGYDDKSDTWEI
jgi:hypothetical protein